MRAAALCAAALVAVASLGCKGPADEDDGPSIVPKAVAFEGRVDPAYVGNWKSADGSAGLALDKEGNVTIDQAITAANGRSTSKVRGKWLVSGGDLLLDYPERSGGETTVKYGAKVSARELALKHGSTTTIYRRE